MITNFIGKGSIEITIEEFDKLPSMVAHELEGTNKSLFRYKFMDMYGNWNMVVVYTNKKNEINFLCKSIKIKG